MGVWRVRRGDGTFEDALFDVEVVDTANPFGNYAIAYIDDSQGTKFDEYTRGTRVDFFVANDVDAYQRLRVDDGETHEVASGETERYDIVQNDGTIKNDGTIQSTGDFDLRFPGYVVESRESNQGGADTLEVECYSYDQFLRRDTVSNDQSGNTISEALEDIVTNDTPISFVAANVEVTDDQTLTRSFRGDRVENALRALSSMSGDEAFGVNRDLEFFFEPRESTAAPRDIDNTQWLNYDIPERGKETVNEVTVFFNDGNESVTVDDGNDKLDLQDKIGTDGPIILAEEATYEDITEREDARAIAEQLLNEREATLTGTVTTFGLNDAEPGDVISITITPRGIDDDFRIAENFMVWGQDHNRLTIVEKRGDQDDLLVRLSDTVKRTEMRNADRDATGNRITSSNVGVTVSGSGDADGTAFDAAKITNTLRNLIRDGWAGDGTVDVTHIAVGNDASEPTRSETVLGNELERVAVSESLPDSTTARYTGSFSETDIREIGLFDTNGDLLARATVPETSFTASVSVTFDLTTANDSSVANGVITDAGQTAVRDIIADNSPALPATYAYGTDGTTPTESDTALGAQAHTEDFVDATIQSADTNSEWSSIT